MILRRLWYRIPTAKTISELLIIRSAAGGSPYGVALGPIALTPSAFDVTIASRSSTCVISMFMHARVHHSRSGQALLRLGPAAEEQLQAQRKPEADSQLPAPKQLFNIAAPRSGHSLTVDTIPKAETTDFEFQCRQSGRSGLMLVQRHSHRQHDRVTECFAAPQQRPTWPANRPPPDATRPTSSSRPPPRTPSVRQLDVPGRSPWPTDQLFRGGKVYPGSRCPYARTFSSSSQC